MWLDNCERLARFHPLALYWHSTIKGTLYEYARTGRGAKHLGEGKSSSEYIDTSRHKIRTLLMIHQWWVLGASKPMPIPPWPSKTELHVFIGPGIRDHPQLKLHTYILSTRERKEPAAIACTHSGGVDMIAVHA